MVRLAAACRGTNEHDDHGPGGALVDPPTAAALAAVPSDDPVSTTEVVDELEAPRESHATHSANWSQPTTSRSDGFVVASASSTSGIAPARARR